MSKRWILQLGCMLAIGASAHGQSTTFVASVADANTHAPIAGADVIVFDGTRMAETNWLGEAAVGGIAWGAHRVRVRKLGYVAADLTLEFAGDTTGQVFLLSESPASLDTVRSTAARVPAYLEPFEARRRLGIGHFLTADQFAAARGLDPQFVIAAHFPGLKIRPGKDGRDILLMTRPTFTHMQRTACALQVYLDGQIYAGQVDIWNFIRTWDLAGAEYYDGVDTPAQYRIAGSDCGVLLLWSRPN